jgi:PLP dependent protein
MSIRDNLARIYEKISASAERCGRRPDDITLLPVTKYVGTDEIRELIKLGVERLGESRIQQALPKIAEIDDHIEWHLIGHLQTNKAKEAVHSFELIHSVDSIKLLEALEKRGEIEEKTVKILLQLSITGEQQKYGAPIEELNPLCEAVQEMPHIQVEGLMTMPPAGPPEKFARPVFKKLREIRDKLAKQKYERVDPTHLSMGMTQDYEIAIEEGATIIRIGSALFE